MQKIKVLFVCIHNSARSQMAEAFLNYYAPDKFIAESAGLEAGELNPHVVEAMRELDIDITAHETNSVFDFFEEGREYDYVITVCDKEAAEKCPIFPSLKDRIHWSFSDPSSAKVTNGDRLTVARKVRDEINSTILDWISTFD